MVCRFIKQQKVRRMQQHPQQRISVALTARKHADALKYFVSGEKEAAEQVAQIGFSRRGRDPADVVNHACVLVEFFVLVLREIVELNVVTELIFARGQWLGPGK